MSSITVTRVVTAALALAIGGGFTAAIIGTAAAETSWEKSHPRRDQVNDRLRNQNRRINDELRDGYITKTQAQKLHREDRQIRQEERDMASQNGGHITRNEQRVLNQQENSVSRQIGR